MNIADKWEGFGVIVVTLMTVVTVLFRMVIGNLKTDREGLVAQSQSLQTQVKELQQLNATQSAAYNQRIFDIYDQRIKEQREQFREVMALSNAAVAASQGNKEELEKIGERLKCFDERLQCFDERLESFNVRLEGFDVRLTALHQDGEDEHQFIQGLLDRLAEKG